MHCKKKCINNSLRTISQSIRFYLYCQKSEIKFVSNPFWILSRCDAHCTYTFECRREKLKTLELRKKRKPQRDIKEGSSQPQHFSHNRIPLKPSTVNIKDYWGKSIIHFCVWEHLESCGDEVAVSERAQVALKCRCVFFFFLEVIRLQSESAWAHESSSTNILHLLNCVRKCVSNQRTATPSGRNTSAKRRWKNVGGGQGWGHIRSGDQQSQVRPWGGTKVADAAAKLHQLAWGGSVRGGKKLQFFLICGEPPAGCRENPFLVSSQTEMRLERTHSLLQLDCTSVWMNCQDWQTFFAFNSDQ